MSIRRLSKDEMDQLYDWRPIGQAITEVLDREYGYSVEDDDGRIVDLICAEIGLTPDWSVAFFASLRRFATVCQPERKRPPWRTATPDECWTVEGSKN